MPYYSECTSLIRTGLLRKLKSKKYGITIAETKKLNGSNKGGSVSRTFMGC
jgi:hypothetical protein